GGSGCRRRCRGLSQRMLGVRGEQERACRFGRGAYSDLCLASHFWRRRWASRSLFFRFRLGFSWKRRRLSSRNRPSPANFFLAIFRAFSTLLLKTLISIRSPPSVFDDGTESSTEARG